MLGARDSEKNKMWSSSSRMPLSAVGVARMETNRYTNHYGADQYLRTAEALREES